MESLENFLNFFFLAGVRDGVAHSKPVFDEICMPGFNYKCD